MSLEADLWNVDYQMTYDSLHSLITLVDLDCCEFSCHAATPFPELIYYTGKFIKGFDKKKYVLY